MNLKSEQNVNHMIENNICKSFSNPTIKIFPPKIYLPCSEAPTCLSRSPLPRAPAHSLSFLLLIISLQTGDWVGEGEGEGEGRNQERNRRERETLGTKTQACMTTRRSKEEVIKTAKIHIELLLQFH
ncbi:hypothetical protein OIU77_011938 [Salix suchowensis]|uniref:Uncharacterized protein n=1 Tax=Salix suchowensis TaxID=1278906 RepID=A0ABQ9A1W8_9ROSI|nr:hypothetical protein OIU77_011938 [Salix suchowensis]